MERRNRTVPHPDRFVASEHAGMKERLVTGIKNLVLRPDLGYTKPNSFEYDPSVQLEHTETCLEAKVRVYPIWKVIALPHMVGPITEVQSKEAKLAQCETCEVEQVLKGGE